MGQPVKATHDVLDEIVELLEKGNYFETACEACGITSRQGRALLKAGREELARVALDGGKPNPKLKREVRFAQAARQAMAAAESEAVTTITKAGERNWQALAWRLERKHHERWGRKDRMEHTGEGGGPIDVEHQVNIDQARARLTDLLERRERAVDAGGGSRKPTK